MLLLKVKEVHNLAFYHCLLLDIDGTMLDFDAAEDCAIKNTLQHYNLPCTEEVVNSYKTINKEMWQAFEKGEIKQEKLVVKRFEVLLNTLQKKADTVQMNNFYLSSLAGSAQLFDGVKETLNDLKEVATLAIITNGVERVQNIRLKNSGLSDMFDDIFVSDKIGVFKPHRKFFDTALKSLGVENRKKVLVVGDSLRADIAGGKAAGLSTCWCNFKNAPLPPETPKPDHTIYHFEELLSIVMQEEELENARNPQKRHQV